MIYSVVVAPSIYRGVEQAIQLAGIGKLKACLYYFRLFFIINKHRQIQ